MYSVDVFTNGNTLVKTFNSFNEALVYSKLPEPDHVIVHEKEDE
jgi:hypothetical protein